MAGERWRWLSVRDGWRRLATELLQTVQRQVWVVLQSVATPPVIELISALIATTTATGALIDGAP